jgi:enterochelin esterase-like enzyme
MRTAFAVSLLLSCLCPPLLAQRDGRRGDDDAPPQLANFTVQRVEFAAPSLERVFGECGVLLPKGYDDDANATRRYPLAIWLHGMNESYTRFLDHGAPVLDALRSEGKVPDLILVAISAGRRTLYFNGERSGDLEDFIVRDVLGHVTAKFRVSEQRADRAIMGVSIGGFGAMRMALKHSDVFGTVAVHSAAVFPADPAELSEDTLRYAQFVGGSVGLDDILGQPFDPKIWQREIPTAILAHVDPKDLHGLRIYFDAGTNDRYGFAQPNQKLHEVLEKRGIAHTFRMIEGGGHSWGSGFTQRELETSLQFVAQGFAADEAQPAKKPASGAAK